MMVGKVANKEFEAMYTPSFVKVAQIVLIARQM